MEMKDDEAENSSHSQDQGGCDIDRYGKRAGKGALIQWERSGTLGVSQDQTLFVWEERDEDTNPK